MRMTWSKRHLIVNAAGWLAVIAGLVAVLHG
jgi:hypothetical protein